MYQGKFNKEGKRFSTKALVAVLAAVLILGSMIGGTIAWLIAKTTTLTNTFTFGDINITLKETDSDGDGNPDDNVYPVIPGADIEKDPLVTVLQDSETCWLFVKLEKSTAPAFDDFMEYEIADGWTPVEGTTDVYYREVSKEQVSEQNIEFEVIKDNTVHVFETVTKEQINALTDYPTLVITAYAVQKDAAETPAAAWALANE